MKDFEYIQPENIEAATAALATKANVDWDATTTRVYAGGQDLLAEMKTGLEEPDALVNIKWAEGMDSLSEAADGNVQFGATTKLNRLEALYPEGPFRVIAEAAATVASPQIRSQATLAGNLCQRPRCLYYRRPEAICLKKGGDECFAYGGHNKYSAILGGGPSYIVHPSDLAPALVALDAVLEIRDAKGSHEVALADFYYLPSEGDVTRENVLRPDEVVVSVRTALDTPAEWRSTYVKFQERDGFDFALSAVALSLRIRGGEVVDARIVLGGVAPMPWRCREAEQLLLGSANAKDIAKRGEAAAEAALIGAEPLDQNAYKIPLTKGLLQRALRHLTAN